MHRRKIFHQDCNQNQRYATSNEVEFMSSNSIPFGRLQNPTIMHGCVSVISENRMSKHNNLLQISSRRYNSRHSYSNPFRSNTRNIFFTITLTLSLCVGNLWARSYIPNSYVYGDSTYRSPAGFRRMDRATILQILERNEQIFKNNSSQSIISQIHSNQYAANSPIEDYKFVDNIDERSCVFGVLDGHGGDECAKWISSNYVPVWKRGFWEYIEKVKQIASYYDIDNIEGDIHTSGIDKNAKKQLESLMNLHEYIPKVFSDTFQFLDQLYYERSVIMQSVPKSGSCAIVGYTHDSDLYIANLGDSRAVLGRKDWWAGWKAVALSTDQNAKSEMEKLQNEHPNDPEVVRGGRVKGILQPSRSFGDFILKIPGLLHPSIVKSFKVFEPPYVSSIPEVRHFTLNPKKGDHFVVLASDGLWDSLTNEEVVNIVANHIESESVDNVATKLIEAALLQNPIKDDFRRRNQPLPDDENLSIVLGLSQKQKRFIHDDITVLVAFLNENYHSGSKRNFPNAKHESLPEELQSIIRKSEARARKIKQMQSKVDL